MTQFWKRLDELVKSSEIIVDRPKGTAHPTYPSFIYPVDYGYLKNVKGSDGNDLDIWVGSKKNKTVTAVLCTVDLTKRDGEMKLLLGCTAQEEEKILAVMNSESMSALLVRRPNSS